jgi:hypothetical protein
MRTRPGGAALIAAIMLLSGCSLRDTDNGRDHDPANQPGYSLPQDRDGSGKDQDRDQDRDKDPDDGKQRDHVVTGERGGRQEATFAMIKGAEVIRVRAADLGGSLYRISTPEDSKAAPAVHVDGGTVLAGLVGTDRPGPAIVTAELSNAVRWRVRLQGGAGEEIVDLTGARVDAVELSTGANRAEVTLPPAAGTTRVTMSGGAGQLLVHLNGDAPVRVRAGGGAGTVTVDGAVHAGVANGTVFAPAGWAQATDRYDIDATAGVSVLTVDRR